jgi:NAD-dependent SIR2 family protein deacetylase
LNPNHEAAIIEIHGSIFETKCSDGRCKFSHFNRAVVSLDPSLPMCPTCGKLARPADVWFGEEIHAWSVIRRLVASADMCIVIGTSSKASSLLILIPCILIPAGLSLCRAGIESESQWWLRCGFQHRGRY